MENIEFYVKYQNCDSVSIETHYNAELLPRPFPLSTVCHLIYAYQFRPGSILANTDSAMLSLRFVKNGDLSDPLRPGLLLKDLILIDASNGTFDNPLVIKKSNQFYSI